MKKTFIYSVAFSLMFFIGFQIDASAAGKELKVTIDGKTIEFPDGKPFINKDSRTMIPIRFVSQNLGYAVTWNEAKKEATIIENKKKVLIKIGTQNMIVNGQTKVIDTKAEIKNGRTYVPISFITKAMNEHIHFDNKTKELKITTKKETENQAVMYKVVAGDSLWAIANKFQTTVDQLKEWNKLTSNTLYVGQMLKVSDGPIPEPSAPSFLANGVMPLKKGTYSPFGDTWGASRTYGGNRTHEGTDIMAPKGTPIYSATDGKVVNYGWNELGGWRISIKTPEGYNLYYAHMSKYASGMKTGITVTKGQLIGYVGDTGYGPTGTSGKFASHLHFGLYDSYWVAMNPYEHLKYWESKN